MCHLSWGWLPPDLVPPCKERVQSHKIVTTKGTVTGGGGGLKEFLAKVAGGRLADRLHPPELEHAAPGEFCQGAHLSKAAGQGQYPISPPLPTLRPGLLPDMLLHGFHSRPLVTRPMLHRGDANTYNCTRGGGDGHSKSSTPRNLEFIHNIRGIPAVSASCCRA